jgi:2-oxoglutarate dehydrogenase E2 component (dihydrolipoamide succinyltransferase)
MAIDLVIPTVGESISEVEIGEWLKQPGDAVEQDEAIVEIESDKATVEVYAPVAGVMGEILKQTGEAAGVGEVIGNMTAGGEGKTSAPKAAAKAEPVNAEPAKEVAPSPAPAVAAPVAMPAAQRAMAEANVDPASVSGTGKDGRILKEDVGTAAAPAAPAPTPGAPKAAPPLTSGSRDEEVVRMTPIRRKIAQHLLSAQQNAALLTTFNEVDMSAVMGMRNDFKDAYLKKYGIKLGFMSFFVKACVDALNAFPAVNAEIRDENIVYKNFVDMGIAVGGKKGLVVPVLRNAERMSFADVEVNISDMGKRARDNKLTVEELTGGTFTITNGGIFGSMLSTPIINPPQSAILGMHNIVERAMVVDGEIVARPMMYVALTYDHRIIDGKEAVSFLVRVKECIENPSRILLEI